jgi:ABC-type transport system involved in cytochrome c biogenesis permease subunit
MSGRSWTERIAAMYEQLWRISFAILLAAVPLNAAQAILSLNLEKAGRLRWMRRAGNWIIALGMAGLTATIISRWRATGYPPFSNMPESLLWMAWGFCAVYFVARIFVDFTGLELAASLGAVAVLAFSSLFDQSPRPLVPALRSNWLIFHVFTFMVSYGAFFAAFCIAILWLALWRKREPGKRLDLLSYQVIAFGFLMLTLGIISGSVWANQAWARYWGWDPKETWSLITWFVYCIYLHVRRAGGKFQLKPEHLPLLNAIFAIVGFALVAFTYFGVTYLLISRHAYASG